MGYKQKKLISIIKVTKCFIQIYPFIVTVYFKIWFQHYTVKSNSDNVTADNISL